MDTTSQANDQKQQQQLATTTNPQTHGNKQSTNSSGQISRTMRHYSNCPLFYLNVANQRPVPGQNPNHHNHNHQHHHNHNHHHAGGSGGAIGSTSGGSGGHQKASFYHIPNLFQNSFKVPLHFRNVYYYKSLLNLNMRLIVLRPHNAGAVTLRSGPQASTTGASHHHHHHRPSNRPMHHHHHHHYVPSTTAVLPNGHNVSLSCPDLNLKQVLVVKKPKRDDNVDSGGIAVTGTSGVLQPGALPIGIFMIKI